MDPLLPFSRLFAPLSISLLILFVFAKELLLLHRTRKSVLDRGSLRRFLYAIFVGVLGGYLLAAMGYGLLDARISFVGVALLLAGFVLRWSAMRTLGNFFTPAVVIQDDHHLITDGPYKMLLHPSYTGLLAELIGFGLILASWPAVVLIVLLNVPAALYRMDVEEQALREKFGDAFDGYRKVRYRLIPYIY